MSNFKIIETQEELDAIIGERIAKAKRKAAEEYADYDEIKKRLGEYESQIATLSEQLKTKDEAISGHDAEIADLNAKVQSYATAAAKTKIAHEFGLPYEFATRITGDTEEAMREDAKALSKFVSQPSAPLGGVEPTASGNEDPLQAGLRSMAHQLIKEN